MLFSFFQKSTEDTYTLCKDGKDNDGDKLIDCKDPDCKFFSHCQPDAGPADLPQPDAPAGGPLVKPSTGIDCNWYAAGTAKLDPLFGQYEINTDDGSIYEKASKTWLRSKSSQGKAVNGIYWNVHAPSPSAPRSASSWWPA